MANWKMKIDVSPAFSMYEENENFEEFKEELLNILDNEDVYNEIEEKIGDEEAYQYSVLVDDLKPTEDEDEFDYTWNDLYDWADENLVWINTLL